MKAKAKRLPTELTIEVGLPDRCLSPNVKAHWAKEYAAKKTLREAVVNTIRIKHPHMVGAQWDQANIQYSFFHPVERTRDDDNHRAMMKAARDAFGPETVTSKGKINPGVHMVNDDTNISDAAPVLFAIDKEHPRVRITITKG